MKWVIRALWVGSGGLLAGALFIRPPVQQDQEPPAVASSLPSGEPAAVAPPDSVIEAAVRAAPFRSSRTPARLRFGGRQSESTLPARQVPQLVLTGLVTGSVQRAVIEGLPGIEGARILGAGDTAGGIRLRTIRNGRVTLSGFDTVWVLSLTEPQ